MAQTFSLIRESCGECRLNQVIRTIGADAAVKALKAAGFAESDISVFDSARLKGG
ncbi:MAG TPA: hypothetical protein VFE60_27995 [Roseiarcus sp.]|jgi:predicted nucleotide-binding protein (sugar kinase/HSP70/actin superfamily)|nr:hypothetical protein [Roseiarcus sp.]